MNNNLENPSPLSIEQPSAKKRLRMTLTLPTLPKELRVSILEYLDEEGLGDFACVSKQCYQDTKDSSLSQERVAVIEGITSSTKVNNFNPFLPSWTPSRHTFLGVLEAISRAASKKKFHSRFTSLKLKGHAGLEKVTHRDAKPFVKGHRLKHITKLDLSLEQNSGLVQKIAPCIARLMSPMLPNLKEVDFSYINVPQTAFQDMAKHCSQLELIICSHSIINSAAVLTGEDMGTCQNLKLLVFDHTQFCLSDSAEEHTIFTDDDASPGGLFGSCIEHLEHVSLKQATYCVYSEQPKALPQASLMKFVRQARNLRSFRSDLTPGNIALLKEERPDITF